MDNDYYIRIGGVWAELVETEEDIKAKKMAKERERKIDLILLS